MPIARPLEPWLRVRKYTFLGPIFRHRPGTRRLLGRMPTADEQSLNACVESIAIQAAYSHARAFDTDLVVDVHVAPHRREGGNHSGREEGGLGIVAEPCRIDRATEG